MKYSDVVKTILINTINELANDPNKYAVNPSSDFSRNRKLGFKDLLFMFLTMEAKCIKEEIYLYFGRKTTAPSKAAFYKQRKKLREDALRNLLLAFNKKLKNNLYNGKYQLIACDGSSLNIYRNPDDPDTFFEPNGKSTRGFNLIHVNAFYSILDRRFTDLVVQPGRKRNEYRAFCEMVDAAEQAAPPSIYFGDMSYASYNNFAHVLEKGHYFLIRCNHKKTQGILGYPLDGVMELDCHVDRILSRSRAKKKMQHPEMAESYRYVCKSVAMDFLTDDQPEYKVSLRVIRIQLEDGSFENIITNLPDLEFDILDFKDLYNLRWKEENSFRDIKYPLCLNAFHSKKYEYVVQEVWARAILHNFSSEVIKNVDIPKRKRKYEYQANFAEGFRTCRDFLRDKDEKTVLDVEGLIAQNIEAVRPGRIFARQQRFKLPVSFCYRN